MDNSEKLFREIVDSYSEKLYWVIRRIVLTHEDANDVIQNAFIKIWQNLNSYRGDAKLYTWLYKIVVNEAIDYIRKEKSRIALSSQTENNISIADKLMADEYFDGDYTEAKLQEAITTLPEAQKKVFLLKYYEDMKYSDISKILDTSIGGLKANYHIAVKKISKYITNDK